MNKHDITLCLIVKNEENYISACIESVQPIVKQILIGDTGSTDNTIAICKQYTDNVETVDFSKGFSYARNQLLKKVKTNWTLFLDADECFDTNELKRLSDVISNATSDTDAYSFLRYNFFSSGAFYTSDTIKLFRNHPEILYSGIVVDSIKPSIMKKGGRIQQAPIILNHFGHCRSIQVRNQKAQKYLEMLDQELVQNPNNFKAIGYKALILRTLGMLDEAYQWMEKALKCAPSEGHPYFVKGHVERVFNRHSQAVLAYTRAIELEGMNPIYLNSRGIAYLTNNSFKEAANDFELGQKLFPNHVHFTINLGLVDQARGDYLQAANRFREVGLKYPSFFKTHFNGCIEVDPNSGYIYDTIFNFLGLAYHLAFCEAKIAGKI
jgi:glycosyltransferase involved in cell wall biosynthesis